MAKKVKTVKEVVEEVEEEGISAEVTTTLTDKHGFQWEVDSKGNKLRRI